MSSNRDEVRPLGPTPPADALRRSIPRRPIAVALGLLALLALPVSPFLAFVVACVALVVILDGRRAFGSGRFRATLAFVAAPWIGLAGVVLAVLGSMGEPGDFLLAPGLLLVAIGLVLLVCSFVALRRNPPEGVIQG